MMNAIYQYRFEAITEFCFDLNVIANIEMFLFIFILEYSHKEALKQLQYRQPKTSNKFWSLNVYFDGMTDHHLDF